MAFPMSTGGAATAILLRSDSPEQTQLARELWDGYSGAPKLLDATTTPGRRKTGYIYDPNTLTYRRADNGLKVTEKQLRANVQKVTTEASRRMRKETQQLIAGTILLSAWHAEMRDLMAALYRTIWVLSIGGFVFEDDTQRNLFYLFVLTQFDWLDNFMFQLRSGVQPLNGMAMNRAGLYGLYGNGMHQNIRLEQHIVMGYGEAKRILAIGESHCHNYADRPGCVELASRGWISIGRMVPIGETTCYSNCLCRIIYR
jgi:hypothetical protein